MTHQGIRLIYDSHNFCASLETISSMDRTPKIPWRNQREVLVDKLLSILAI